MAWDQQFEDVLREYLPFLPEDESLTADTDMRDSGLDSMGTVELLGALEALYDIRFVDEALSLDTFATPAVLWATIEKLTSPASA
ncbi:phosphopantetheine-binding protein [Streptomyces monticola]|uniref:Phosphopantetheine-binding protein n=1 Tax=Streptomyces monticola TaxID=2666263 RepID=A0ABW2JXL3_9ACTN